MPPEGIQWQPHESIMPFEDISRFVRIAAAEGIKEVRITGGEPLVRKDIPDLIGQISAIPGIEDLSLTTNGILLKKYAKDLANAGLKRVNISLDTLRPELFRKITRGGELGRVMEGIESAEMYGLLPIKINTVILRDVNSSEIEALASLTLEHPWIMRFIELMPVRNQKPWGEDFPSPESMFFPISEVKGRLEAMGLEPVAKEVGEGPAEDYRISKAKGTIGFISPLSQAFCERCNRLRLTADGNLRPCLLSDLEIPIWKELKQGGDVVSLLHQAVNLKPESHELDENHSPTIRCMMQIGG
jgi:cyclic pyranopterin phosphate synthase